MSYDFEKYGFRASTQQRFFSAVSGYHTAKRALVVVRVDPSCDPSGLRSALDRLLQRHEILRTRYVQLTDSRTPVQVIDEKPSLQWIGDRQTPSSGELKDKIEEVRALHVREGERLTGIVQCSLSRLNTGDSLFALSVPLLSSDWVTLSNIVVQLAAEYAGKPLDSEPLQYCDFSEWQYADLEGLAQGEISSAAERASFLSDSVSGLSLRFEYNPVATNQPVVDQVLGEFCAPLADSIYRGLKALSSAERVHVKEILYQCWRVLLWRYAGQCSDGWLGRIDDGRDMPDLQGALGLFARWNVTPLRLQRDFTLASLLRTAVPECGIADMEAMCQRVPDCAASVRRSLDFEYQQRPILDIPWELVRGDCHLKPCRLKLVWIDDAESLLAKFVYPTDTFDRNDIAGFAASFESLVANALEHPERSIEALSLVDRQARSVHGFSAESVASSPPDIWDLIHSAAQGSVDDVVIVDNDSVLTWRQLLSKSNGFAHWLLAYGAKPESVVALVMERSLDAVAVILGTLKAGCVYAPIDPSLPPARIRRLLDRIRPLVVISADAVAVPGFHSAKHVNLPSQWGLFDSAQSSSLTDHVFGPAQLAYMIFTSGSTGDPKVVAVTRGSLANYTEFILKELPVGLSNIGERPRFAMVSTLAADLGNTVLFGALAGGGVLHLVSRDVAMDTALLGEYLEKHQVNVLKIVPSHLRAVTEAVQYEMRSLRWLICGGEVLDWRLLSRIRQVFPSAKVTNHYGPTETTVGTLVYSCDPELATDERLPCVPIGAPIAQTDAVLLNEALEVCPPWVPGEIHIAGNGLARGYIGSADLTAASFIPRHPNGDRSSRMYRTGDIAFTLPTGRFVFLGRRDDQVKLRGYRIELKEVERCILDYPGVLEAFVTVLQADNVATRLSACVVPAAPGLSLQTLRVHLREQLPEYMVPGSLLALPALPLTQNGKLDRNAITQLLITHAAGVERHAEDQLSWVEEITAGIWKDLLGVNQVSPHNDFFELGGHSLAGTQLIARIREIFRTEIPVRMLFEMPVLRDFGHAVEESMGRFSPSECPPIELALRTAPLPLSFSQQRLWFIEQMRQGSPGIYNCSAAVRVTGPLNVQGLEQAFLDVIARHETLRTGFESVDGTPQQHIHAEIPWCLSVEDYTGSPAETRMEEALRAVARGAGISFNLSRPPLFRFVLHRLSEHDHILDICIHHIISDAWSMGIMIRDLAVSYQQHTRRESGGVPPLPVQYADFAVWQRRLLSGRFLDQQVDYWRKQLQDAPNLNLPTDVPRPLLRAGIGAEEAFQLPIELSDAVEARSRQHGLSPFMYLFAVWQLVLARYSGQDDVVVGSPVAGRTHKEHEGVVGCFINMLALRTHVSVRMTARELLEQVRETCLNAYANQHLPFDNLVSRLELERDTSRTPLFQAIFNFHNTPQQAFSLTDLQAEWLRIPASTSRFELELNMWLVKERLGGTLVYDRELFGQNRIQRMIKHFANVLQGMVQAPECPLEMISMMDRSEREQVLNQGRPEPAAYPQRCIHELFSEVATTFSHKVAIACGGGQLTYGELDERSSQVAQMLLGNGVGREEIVAVALDRSIEAIVSFLAILKVGAAYLPLDIHQPRARLEFMLADSKAVLVLVRRESLDLIPTIAPRVLCIGDTPEFHTNQGRRSVGDTYRCCPENLAYVMYTSGSAGSPKAVVVNHRGVVRLVKNTNFVTLDEKKVILQFTVLGFDVSTFEIWGALLNGARLEIFANQPWSSRDLAAFIARKNIDTLWLTSPVFERMVDDEISAFARVKQVVAGGDVVPFDQSRRLLTTYPELTLVNGYGPTENTTFTTAYPMRSPAQLGHNSVPIGGPIANTDVYVLDRSLEPMPLGVPGELYAGGDGLARGYAGQPELTAAAFVPNPYTGAGGARMYRTGDRVYWREDGNLEFLGRTDDQIKLRAFRIEPREIEAALLSYAGVREALVMAKGNGDERRLVAFVARANRGGELDRSDLLNHLKPKLPEYMIPSSFVVVDEFPLNPSGKHDVAALARLPETRFISSSHSAPQTSLEIRIANVWKEVLGVERVGIHDSFFEAGGDSLLLVKLHSRLLKELELEISVIDLFRRPTIASLALSVTKNSDSERPNVETNRGEKRRRAAVARRALNTPSSLS